MSSPEGFGSEPTLLPRARNDLVLLGKITSDSEVADEIVGFHAQQTVEKALKAVLEHRVDDDPGTHDPARLFELLERSGGAPANHEAAFALSPWAAQFRYGDVVGETLDREHALAVAEVTLAWAEAEITG